MSKLDALIAGCVAIEAGTAGPLISYPELRRVLEAVREDMATADSACASMHVQSGLCAAYTCTGKRCPDCPLHEYHAAMRAAFEDLA